MFKIWEFLFGGEVLFESLSFRIGRGDRIGPDWKKMVRGKSTLLKLLGGAKIVQHREVCLSKKNATFGIFTSRTRGRKIIEPYWRRPIKLFPKF